MLKLKVSALSAFEAGGRVGVIITNSAGFVVYAIAKFIPFISSVLVAVCLELHILALN